MNKRVFVCFVSLALLISLVNVSAAGQRGADTGDEITLRYWSWDPSLRSRNEQMIASFEAQNPGIRVEMTTLEPSEYWTQLRILANQNQLPDVFNLSSGFIEEWANNNLLMDLEPFIDTDLDKDAFYMNLVDAVRDLSGTDNYYAFPYALVTTVMYYNMDLFDEAGLDYPDSDWTWNDFLTAARLLTRDTNNDGNIDQWGYFFYGRYAHVESWIYSNNGRLIDRSTMRFDPDANAMDALKFLSDLVLVEKVAPPYKEMSAFRQQDVFPNGVAAMWVDGSWNIDNNREIGGDSFRWAIAELPIGPAGRGDLTYGWPDSLAIAANTRHAEAAWKFTRFASGEGLSMDMVLGGKIPSYRPLTESTEFLDISQQPHNKDLLITQVEKEMRTDFSLAWGEWRGYGASEALGFNGIIDGIINGDMSFDEGMETAFSNINRVLARAYR